MTHLRYAGAVAVQPVPVPPQTAAERVARHNARWYFTGLAASLVGNSAMSLVAGVWVKSLTQSSAQAGLVGACAYAGTVVAPLAGLVADRLPRRRLLLRLNLLAAATVLPLLLVRSGADTWLLFAVMAAYGVEATLMDPAEDALFAQMFSDAFRRRINGWRLTIQETGRLASPLLGAGLFVLLGGGAVAALDAATFLVAALVITRLRVDDAPPARPAEAERFGPALRAGVSHITHTAGLRPVAIAATLVMALSGAGVAAQYSLVHGLGERPAFLGVLSALLGAGSIVAALSAGRLIDRYGESRLAIVGLIDYAAGDLLRASGWLPAAVAGSLVLGFALPYVFLATLNLAQRLTPQHLQGRVSAALTLSLFGPAAPMQALGALLIAHATYPAILVGSAVVSLAIGGWLGLRSAHRSERSGPSVSGRPGG
ncbi:MAG: MFS transporter [Solirubrobacteraceae bacterium]